jgi:hypothetical protein
MLLRMGLAGLLGVFSRVKRMASSRVGMMCGFLVVSAIVMLGRFAVMVGSMGMMFCGVPMVLGCFFRHEYDLVMRRKAKKRPRHGGPLSLDSRKEVSAIITKPRDRPLTKIKNACASRFLRQPSRSFVTRSWPLGAATKNYLPGAEQPFATIVDGRAPGEPPSPSPSITRRRTPAALAVGVHPFQGTASRPR